MTVVIEIALRVATMVAVQKYVVAFKQMTANFKYSKRIHRIKRFDSHTMAPLEPNNFCFKHCSLSAKLKQVTHPVELLKR